MAQCGTNNDFCKFNQLFETVRNSFTNSWVEPFCFSISTTSAVFDVFESEIMFCIYFYPLKD